MKSTGCRDVQHTGLQSTQTRRNYSSNNTGKQDAQTRGHLRIPKHPYISGCMIIVGYANQFKLQQIEKMLGCLTCMIIVGYANQFKVTTNWKKTARLFDMQCSHWCRDAWEFEDAPLFVHLAYQCCCCYSSFLFVCFVGLYAGHPYIQLISFEIFLLSCYYYSCTKKSWTWEQPEWHDTILRTWEK